MNSVIQLWDRINHDQHELHQGFTAMQIAERYNLSRSVVSRYLNQLVIEGKLLKGDGRPVVFFSAIMGCEVAGSDSKSTERITDTAHPITDEFNLIGAKGSLKKAVKQAKAAVLYPPHGLHTLIHGETGVGKSHFAREMYQFAIHSGRIKKDAPFVLLNCADYADNPQLLMSEIFGVKKGAYTGADRDREGLLQKANQGFLFLDEIHRLPPQGQEMLFTFMDYGHFRPLGGNTDITGVEVQIIAATTENPESVLLDTFKRRIPMMIELPSLAQRTLEERKQMIMMFLKQESLRINKPITMSRNAFISLLLYECRSNIGQMRTDIQQACAKAFLHYVSNDEAHIKVRSVDLSSAAKAGYNHYKNQRAIVDALLPPTEETLYSDEVSLTQALDQSTPEDFYTSIAEKYHVLKSQGLDEEAVRQIVGSDIEKQFETYLRSMKQRVIEHSITKVVGEDFLTLTEKLMTDASQRLGCSYLPALRSAFTLHMASAIERIQNRQPIYNPRLNQIRIEHTQAFLVAMDLAREMEIALGIVLPIDEIGYITMFLANTDELNKEVRRSTLPVIVMMHGKSTATSMAEVVNELIGDPIAVPFDMPLSMPVEAMYQSISNYFLTHEIKEALMMVDMGSLSNFGEMLYEDHGFHVRTLVQTSTPLLLEVVRKAASGHGADEIVASISKQFQTPRSTVRSENSQNKLMIITACFTGEGTAERMKRIIEKRIAKPEQIVVKSVDLADRSAYLATIEHMRSEYQVVAIASTINIPVDDIPVFSALDLLSEEGLSRLEAIVEKAMLLSEISKSIKETVDIPSHELVGASNRFIDAIEARLGKDMQADARIGFLLHMVFYIDNRLKGVAPRVFDGYRDFLLKNGGAYDKLEDLFESIEHQFYITIPTDERALLLKVILSNLE